MLMLELESVYHKIWWSWYFRLHFRRNWRLVWGRDWRWLLFSALVLLMWLHQSSRLRSINNFGTSADPTWDNVNIAIWTDLGLAVIILYCNIQSISSLINNHRRHKDIATDFSRTMAGNHVLIPSFHLHLQPRIRLELWPLWAMGIRRRLEVGVMWSWEIRMRCLAKGGWDENWCGGWDYELWYRNSCVKDLMIETGLYVPLQHLLATYSVWLLGG